jgi:hypothetical protein
MQSSWASLAVCLRGGDEVAGRRADSELACPLTTFPRLASMNAIASSSRSALFSSTLVSPRIASCSASGSVCSRSFSSSTRWSAASQNHYKTLDLDRAATKKQIKEKFYEVSRARQAPLPRGPDLSLHLRGCRLWPVNLGKEEMDRADLRFVFPGSRDSTSLSS